MIQLIKKGGLRERANRSRSYKGSENTETTLQPNRYRTDLIENNDKEPVGLNTATQLVSSEQTNAK